MLMAYEDLGFKIKDIPADDPRVPLYPIESLSSAEEIMVWARTEHPTVRWVIEGKGPYRVHGEIQ
jgi:hypothetical protein